MYHVYHIPGKKVGVTSNLEERVTKQQGYEPGEYTVVYSTDEISVASIMERELQEAFGYKVDETLYENLTVNTKNKNTMNINVTEQTTTFACPVSKLKGQLMDNLGMQWTTQHGEFTITRHSITWILDNTRSSQFSNERCFIYNKAFAKYYDGNPGRNVIAEPTFKANTHQEDLVEHYAKAHAKDFPTTATLQQFDLIRDWAEKRGIYNSGDSKTQYVKLMEEAGELAKALLNKDNAEIVDAIGDMVVVLTNLAKLEGYNIEFCIESAYNEIANRKGKMLHGTFVKENN